MGSGSVCLQRSASIRSCPVPHGSLPTPRWRTPCLMLSCVLLHGFIFFPPAHAWSEERHTVVAIEEGRWHINGEPTYPGAPAEGLLMNVRMVNAVFEDTGPEAGRLPEGFTPDANADAFIARIPDYVEQGIRAFTINLQGGRPSYSQNHNSAFEADGALRPGYMERVHRVIEASDRNGVVVILGCFYQSQHAHPRALSGREAILAAIANTAEWIRREGFSNVLLEIANEPHVSGFRQWQDSEWMQSEAGRVEQIETARRAHPGLLVSTGGTGTGRTPEAVALASDFILIHFNNTPLEAIPERIEALRQFNKPIVCNEDDKIGEAGARAAALSVQHGASWGFMHKDKNQFIPFEYDGAQDDPAVYSAIQRLTTAPGP